MMFAQGLFDFGLNDKLLEIVRIIATVGGAVVGWFLCDLLTRLLYRISFRAATPGALLFVVKAGGAAGLAAAIYFLMPLGGAGGGLGFGPGAGAGPGKGPGSGGDKTDSAAKDKADIKPKTVGPLPVVAIEILGGERFSRFQTDKKDRFYLLKGTNMALALEDLDDYFKKHEAKIQVIAVLTKDTAVGSELIGSPLDALRKHAATHKIDVLTKRED